jgi:putative ABC transport system permease protein
MNDFRYALKRLRRDKLFTGVAAATLALGIGTNTTIFAGIRAVALRPLPYPEPERLVAAFLVWPSGVRGPWSYPKLKWLRRVSRKADWAGMGQFPMTLARDRALPVLVETVTENYFDVFGVRPVFGRTFRADETVTPRGDRLLILGHELWRTEFGGDSGVVGSSVVLNKTAFTIVGVMPHGFVGHSGRADCWAPITMTPAAMPTPRAEAGVLDGVHWRWLSLVGRIRPEASLGEVRTEVNAIHAAMEREWPHPADDDPHWRPLVLSLREAYYKPELVHSLALLQGAVGLVLFLACLNVSSLVLTRALRHDREMAIRQALGARTSALIRLIVLEIFLVTVLGGAMSVLLTVGGMEIVRAFAPSDPLGGPLLEATAIRLDRTVLALTAVLMTVSTIAVSLLPVIRLWRVNLDETLRRDTAQSLRGALRLRPWAGRGLLIVGEVALAYSLVVGGWVLMRSFDRLLRSDPGFRAENVLTLRLSMTDVVASQESGRRLEDLRRELATLPGIQAAGLANCLPASRACQSSEVVMDATGARTVVGFHSVGPGSFRALGIRLRQGREFTEDDGEAAAPVAILNRRAAEALGGEVLGRRVLVRGWGALREVVGVVDDAKYLGLDAPAQSDVYVPSRQAPFPIQYLVLRTRDDPGSHLADVRRTISALDRTLRLSDVRTMEERLAEAMSDRRFVSILLAAFAGLALMLASIGTYASVTAVVSQGRREIAVRMALGASPASVFRAVTAQALMLAAVGLAAGTAISVALTGGLKAFLFGVGAHDPLAYFAAAVTSLATLALATLLPAGRAARVDPMGILRTE